MITQERLKELLYCCPETSIFTWKIKRRGVVKCNSTAGLLILLDTLKLELIIICIYLIHYK